MTGNRIFFTIVLVLSFFFVYFYGGIIPYMLFFTVSGLLLYSFIYTLLILVRFKYFQEIDKRYIVKGDIINYIFTISNEDFFFYPYISVSFFGYDTIFSRQFKKTRLSLKPGRHETFTFSLDCKYSGKYEIGVQRIEIEDFFGLFKFWYKVPFPLSITVYPRVLLLDRFQLKTDFTTESYTPFRSHLEDIGSINDVRKYIFGDSLKKVHWNITAKLGEIMVRQFQSTTQSSVLVIPDFMKNSYTVEQNTIIEDKILESVIAVVHYCLNNWVPVNLISCSGEVTDVTYRDPAGFSHMYNLISETGFHCDADISALTDIYVKTKVKKTNLVVCTANLTYDLYNVLYSAALSGFNVILIYINPKELTGEDDRAAYHMGEDLPRIGATVYRMDLNDDIKGILEVAP